MIMVVHDKGFKLESQSSALHEPFAVCHRVCSREPFLLTVIRVRTSLPRKSVWTTSAGRCDCFLKHAAAISQL